MREDEDEDEDEFEDDDGGGARGVESRMSQLPGLALTAPPPL